MEIKILEDQSELENLVRICLCEAKNGWTVTAMSSRKMEGETYVFGSLQEVADNLESIFSVAKQDPKEITKEDLAKEEERING